MSPGPVLCSRSWWSCHSTLISTRRNRKCHTFNETQCCKNSLWAFPRSKITVVDQFFSQIELTGRFQQDYSLQDHNLYCQDTIRGVSRINTSFFLCNRSDILKSDLYGTAGYNTLGSCNGSVIDHEIVSA